MVLIGLSFAPVQALIDGYALACGTGIETCEGYAGTKLTAWPRII